MEDYNYLSVSNGSGDPPLMHVETDRLTGSTNLEVDITTNIPSYFIATSGTLDANDKITPASARTFKGHLNDGVLVIDEFAPGSVDDGHTAGQVVVIRPNTLWADILAQHVKNITGNGTPEPATVSTLSATGAVSLEGDVAVGGNVTVTGSVRSSPRVIAAASTGTLSPNIDTANIYDLTAQAANLTIANPAGTAKNGDPLIFRIKDNGTSRTISYGTAYSNISGLDLITATTAGKWHTIGAMYNSATENWQIVSISTGA